VLPPAVEGIAQPRAGDLLFYPDGLLDELEATSADPAVAYDLRESAQLAFLAAVQLQDTG
jgi:hypothetical protein